MCTFACKCVYLVIACNVHKCIYGETVRETITLSLLSFKHYSIYKLRLSIHVYSIQFVTEIDEYVQSFNCYSVNIKRV